MFRACLLLIIRRYYSVYTAIVYVIRYVDWPLAGSDWTRPTAGQHKHMTYTNCCIYRVVPPDDEQ
jgi:hypothetical protein